MFAAADINHQRERPPPCGYSGAVQGHPDDVHNGRHDDMMMLLPLNFLAK